MYLTVQRVRSPRYGSGINGAVYLHQSNRGDPRWSPPDLVSVVGGDLGKQVVTRVDIAPGGNAVESFLDIVCPDDVPLAELGDALERFARDLRGSLQPKVYGFVALRFSPTRVDPGDELSSFAELCKAALDLFNHPRDPQDQPWLRQEPLVIMVETNESGWRFVVEDASRSRLTSRFGEALQLSRVSVPYSVADEFRDKYGELYPFVVEWVTSKPRNELLSLGGVRLVRKGKTVWEWPRRAS